MNLSLVNAGQMKRLVNASKNFVLLLIKPKDDIENEVFQGCNAKLKSDLYKVVNQYDEMFKEPKGLPPKGVFNMKFNCNKIVLFQTLVMENAEI
jgi:hypothetical protein